MQILLAIVALVTPLVTGDGTQATSSLTVRFIGNEAVAITDGRLTIVTDFPYESGYSGYMRYDWSSHGLNGEVISLVTHQHPDHFEPKLFAQTDWKVIGPSTLDVPKERLTVPDKAVRAGGATITAIRTPHARLEHYSYLVEWNGKRMYFVGDTDSTDALIAQRDLDLVFVTSWLWQAVQREQRTIDARRIVLYHHQASEPLPTCARCTVPTQGGSIEFAGQ